MVTRRTVPSPPWLCAPGRPVEAPAATPVLPGVAELEVHRPCIDNLKMVVAAADRPEPASTVGNETRIPAKATEQAEAAPASSPTPTGSTGAIPPPVTSQSGHREASPPPPQRPWMPQEADFAPPATLPAIRVPATSSAHQFSGLARAVGGVVGADQRQ
jgi:hypothetical protein